MLNICYDSAFAIHNSPLKQFTFIVVFIVFVVLIIIISLAGFLRNHFLNECRVDTLLFIIILIFLVIYK